MKVLATKNCVIPSKGHFPRPASKPTSFSSSCHLLYASLLPTYKTTPFDSNVILFPCPRNFVIPSKGHSLLPVMCYTHLLPLHTKPRHLILTLFYSPCL